MKRIVLTLPLLLCTLCFTYCQHSNTNNRTPNGFIQPEINPALYQNHTKNISLQDSDVVRKIHELDCYFEDKVKIGFNGLSIDKLQRHSYF